MKPLPFYAKPAHPNISLSPRQDDSVHMMAIVDFLKWVVNSDQLEISDYLGEMTDDSFFLVAATGLGKTVAVPIHVLIRQIERSGRQANPKPRVWVVEPRIPIATEQQEYMNHLWDEFCKKHGRTKRRKSPLFGCVTSVSGSRNPDAPIQFVTTGIFELLASEGKLDPVHDRVIIDEAHVTVEQNAGVEIGVALARKAGVTIDYMSATVDTANLQQNLGVANIIRADKARNIIWKTNLQATLDESIVELVDKTLVHPDVSSRFFPPSSEKHAAKVIQSATDPARAHGMLIVVNSFNGETSDIQKLTRKIGKSFPTLPVLQLAGDVVRDPKRQAEFKRRLTETEQRKQNYVIISTSVVEMGITFPTLDFATTMDSGYDQETIGDVTFPVIAPLGVNSLLQRIGRVGRRYPGIAYISNEVGADYSSLEDAELNRGGLKYEAIRYPLASAPLMPLAFYAVKSAAKDYPKWLSELDLPSRIHENDDRMEYFNEQIEKLEQLGIAEDGRLTELGSSMEQWIGRADIAYATHLQKCLFEGASHAELLFWIVATALSNTSAVSLRAQHSHFVDYNDEYAKLAHRMDVWSGSQHEDIATFKAFAAVERAFPGYLWNPKLRNSLAEQRFRSWASWCGLDARKLTRAAQAIADTLKLFVKINGKSVEFRQAFQSTTLTPTSIHWDEVYDTLNEDIVERELSDLSGTTRISVTRKGDIGPFEWRDQKHGHEGILNQDDTPVRLVPDSVYTARVMPSRESKSDTASWRLTSLGFLYTTQKVSTKQPVATLPATTPTTAAKPAHVKVVRVEQPSTPTPAPATKKKGFWSKLLGL